MALNSTQNFWLEELHARKGKTDLTWTKLGQVDTKVDRVAADTTTTRQAVTDLQLAVSNLASQVENLRRIVVMAHPEIITG